MAAHAQLMGLLQGRMETLSKSQRLLARHVVDNPHAVAFATIGELARQAGVSEATIVRCAHALGFSGWPALQKEVRRIVRAELKGTDRFTLTPTDAPPANGPLDRVLRKERENLAHLEEVFDAEALTTAAALVRTAPRILVVGARSTAGLATHLWFALDKLRLPVDKQLTLDSSAVETVDRLPAGACVLVIGFPRYLRAMVDLLDQARGRGLRTIVLTDSPFSALKGDVGLYAPAESSSFLAFHAAPLILVNTLVDTISRTDEAATLAALRNFEALAERAGWFLAA